MGFRYEACLLAGRLELTGWVRNRSDGAVEAELEGERARIDRFLQGMRSIRRIRITELQIEELPLRMNESGFRPVYQG